MAAPQQPCRGGGPALTPRQLALDFEHRPALGSEDFIVAGANRDAVAWIDRWPDWPAPGSILVGPAASGKTHLSNVWASRSAARPLAYGDLDAIGADSIVASGAAVVIEGLDRKVTPAAETALLHTVNLLAEAGGYLLATSRTAPARLSFGLADLASRVRAFPVVALRQPDDALLAAVLRKQFADRQLVVGQGVIGYLLRHGERSFAAAKRTVARIDRAALQRKRQVTVALVRDILASVD